MEKNHLVKTHHELPNQPKKKNPGKICAAKDELSLGRIFIKQLNEKGRNLEFLPLKCAEVFRKKENEKRLALGKEKFPHEAYIRKILMKKIFVSIFIAFFAFPPLFALQIWEKITPKQDKEVNFEAFDEVKVCEKEEEFVVGEDLFLEAQKRKIFPFYMNKYETTYELWYEVRKAGEKIGYRFMNPGQEGTDGKRGKAPSEKKNLPVVNITWYDAVVWCNALSELSGLTPCYTYKNETVKDSAVTNILDLVECDFSASGFRLPTESEWEFAARKTKSGMNAANKISADFTKVKNEEEMKSLIWTNENADCAKTVGTAGKFSPSLSKDTSQNEDETERKTEQNGSEKELYSSKKRAETEARAVRVSEGRDEAASGIPNAMGLFDMSGNVMEFCFDWYGEYEESEAPYYAGRKSGFSRVSRGGSYSKYTPGHLSGDRYFYDPNEFYNYIGFRFARSAKSESTVKEKI